jgi:hypothetical protein
MLGTQSEQDSERQPQQSELQPQQLETQSEEAEPNRLPFSDECLQPLLQNPRSNSVPAILKWTKFVAGALQNFIDEHVLDESDDSFLYDRIGYTPEEWLASVPKMAGLCIKIADDQVEPDTNLTDISIARHILKISMHGRVPGDDNTRRSTNLGWKYSSSYRLALAAVQDINDSPTGYFATLLDGRHKLALPIQEASPTTSEALASGDDSALAPLYSSSILPSSFHSSNTITRRGEKLQLQISDLQKTMSEMRLSLERQETADRLSRVERRLKKVKRKARKAERQGRVKKVSLFATT